MYCQLKIHIIVALILVIVINTIYVIADMLKGTGHDGVILLLRNAQNTNAVMCTEGNKITVEILKSTDVLLLFFLPILMSVLISDFSFDTIRNSVISGYSNVQIYVSKVITSTIVSMLVVIAYVIITYIVAFIKGGYNLGITSIIDTVRVILLQTPLYISFIIIYLIKMRKIGLIMRKITKD